MMCFIIAVACLSGAELSAWDLSVTRGGVSTDEESTYQESGFYASFNEEYLMMSFLWHNGGSLDGLVLVSGGDDVTILWNSESGIENLHILPHEYGVNLEYPIPMGETARDAADYGLITVNLDRSENYEAFHYAVGFFYDYFDFLNTGIEVSGKTEDGRTDFSVRPVFHFKDRDIISLRCGLDLVSMFTGDIRKMIYLDFRAGWKW